MLRPVVCLLVVVLVVLSSPAVAQTGEAPAPAGGAGDGEPSQATSTSDEDVAKKQFLTARELYEAGDHAVALPLFEEALRRTDSPNARLYVARCLRGLGRLAEAYNAMLRTSADASKLAAPNPDTCAIDTGNDSFTVDQEVNPPTPGNASHGFLRFDLDNQLSGLTVVDVQLELTAGSAVNAAGPASGEIWSCAAFARSDLFLAPPATSSLLAADLGAVASLETVSFTLPITPAANSSVFLSVVPTASNGVDYYNLAGASPPKLLITAQ